MWWRYRTYSIPTSGCSPSFLGSILRYWIRRRCSIGLAYGIRYYSRTINATPDSVYFSTTEPFYRQLGSHSPLQAANIQKMASHCSHCTWFTYQGSAGALPIQNTLTLYIPNAMALRPLWIMWYVTHFSSPGTLSPMVANISAGSVVWCEVSDCLFCMVCILYLVSLRIDRIWKAYLLMYFLSGTPEPRD